MITQQGAAPPELATLSAAKRRLLERRVQALRAGNPRPDIPRRRTGERALLSDAQQSLLLLDHASEDLTAYNVAQALRLSGHLAVDALRWACDELVRRHEVLRSRFTVIAGHTELHIDEPGACDFTTTTVENVDSFVHAAVTQPFDLAAGRLLRVRVGMLGPQEHVLVIVTHHIVSDAVSKRILSDELTSLYAARVAGEPNPLEPPRLQYADYAAWQATRMNAADHVDWWRRTLAGAPEQTDLPTDRPRPARPDNAGAKYTQRLDAALVAGLEECARGHLATTFMVLLAGYAALLERQHGQGDVVVGSPTSGRHDEQLHDVVGLFLNTLPLRIDTSGDPSFAQLLDRVRDTAIAAYRHQDVPFDRIVDAVRPHREAGRNPLFQSMITFKQGADTTPRLAGLHTVPVNFDGGWTKFDLALICYGVDDGLAVLWQYATALFDSATIVRLAEQFDALLRHGLADPTTPLSKLHLAADSDVAAIEGWNATDTPVEPACVHSLISEQVARTPDARAVGDSTGWITYRELDERANRLAQYLVSLGVQPDARVAIFLNRSIALQIALLAVLKAGGAYVPLDPGYPRDRLEFMLFDSGAVALITESALAALAPPHAQTVPIDRLDLSLWPAQTPDSGVRPHNLAYVIYTSGTTGRPKGVQLEHASVANQLRWMRQQFRLSGEDTVLQKTPISFDVAGWEVLLAPMAGAGLYMAKPNGHLDPDYLIDVAAAERITVINFVPSMLSVFVARPHVQRCASLRLVISAGEALSDATKEQCLLALPGADLYNLYGPTETAIGITYERCRIDRSATIGRPMHNCRAYVLDGAGGHQPLGMPGELFLGGVQLARGYLERPELSAERFVETGLGRLYRTGDRAAWQADGRLHYLGRLDEQVKLRGFRIELGEIESVLATHSAVQGACAVIAATGSGEPTLAAFVSVRPDEQGAVQPGAASGTDQVPDWITVWEQAYRAGSIAAFRFELSGWVSSFTDQPFSAAELHEWISTTAERIVALRPKAVLEVGVGSGLLQQQLAPAVQRYDGTDFPASALTRTSANAAHLAGASVRAQPAHEITSDAADTQYDVVVLNSLAHYFPSADYLREVLARAFKLLRPGGSVFVGDVRDLRLARAFALAVAHAHAEPQSATDLRLRLDDGCALDPELLIDPAFFNDLAGLSHVQIMPRRGQAQTEMNKFRYDVVLHTATSVARPIEDQVAWPSLDGLAGLTELLESRRPLPILVAGIPNARVAGELNALDDLADSVVTVPTTPKSAVDPEHLHELAGRLGYRLELSCLRDPAVLDAAFTTDATPAVFPAGARPEQVTSDPAGAFDNDRRRRDLTVELGALLRDRLPEYMVPHAIRVVEHLPLTPAGKLDRRSLRTLALPTPRATVVQPRNDTERRLATLWQQTLGIDGQLSVDDSFFDLGGNSLLALTLFPRIEREFRLKLALAMLFENVTIASLARVIDDERTRRDAWDALVQIRAGGDKRTLFVTPELRGDVLTYREVLRWLDPDRPVSGIQCVGLDGRHAPRLTIEAIATDCVAAIRKAQPAGPYLLAGYCFGGVVAYEAAAQLERAGEQIDFLGVIDATPFGRGTTTVARDRPTLRQRFTFRTRAELDTKVTFVREVTRYRANIAVSRLYGALNLRIPHRFVDVRAANMRASRSYVAPDTTLTVHLFRASAGSTIADDLRRQRWAAIAGGGVSMHTLAGREMDHYQIIKGDHAALLGKTLNDCLADLP